jgi:hypothetical protein
LNFKCTACATAVAFSMLVGSARMRDSSPIPQTAAQFPGRYPGRMTNEFIRTVEHTTDFQGYPLVAKITNSCRGRSAAK